MATVVLTAQQLKLDHGAERSAQARGALRCHACQAEVADATELAHQQADGGLAGIANRCVTEAHEPRDADPALGLGQQLVTDLEAAQQRRWIVAEALDDVAQAEQISNGDVTEFHGRGIRCGGLRASVVQGYKSVTSGY